MEARNNKDLPIFAYGVWQQAELAFPRISEHVARVISDSVQGELWWRDGLPLLSLGGSGTVRGDMLCFERGRERRAYDTIARFEPGSEYNWGSVETVGGWLCNVLEARDLHERGAVRWELSTWSSRDDPLLKEGLAEVRSIVSSAAGSEFQPAPADVLDWPRLFRLQMAYLFLWSIVQRYLALSYGRSSNPDKLLAGDGRFREALPGAVQGIVLRPLYRSDRPHDAPVALDASEPKAVATYLWRVRGNLIHRGKGGWQDAEITRKSLIILCAIMERLVTGKPGAAHE